MSKQESIITQSSFLMQQSQSEFQSICKEYQLKFEKQQCSQGNEVKMICVDEDCTKSVASCGQESCKQCNQGHKKCIVFQLAGFASLLASVAEYQNSFFRKICKIELDIAKKVHQSKIALASQISHGSLDQESVSSLQIISGKKKIQNFNGKISFQLLSKLKKKSKEVNKNEDELQKIFQKMSHKMIEENIKLKQQIFKHFLEGTKPQNIPAVEAQPYFLDSPLLTQCLNELYMNSPNFFQKKIYNNYGYLLYPDAEKIQFDKVNTDFLKTSLSNPTQAHLLYRATEHGFNHAKFHQLCDGKGNTLVIIRTEFQRTIFAFSPCAWNSSNQWVNDSANKACIIWLSPRVKHVNNNSNTIYCNSGAGPRFGNDITISGNTISTSFPSTYNPGYNGGANQINYTQMIGCPTTNSCKILQYEVYALTF